MTRLKTPVLVSHGLTADVDYIGNGPCVHISGIDSPGHAVILRFNQAQLDILQRVLNAAMALYKED